MWANFIGHSPPQPFQLAESSIDEKIVCPSSRPSDRFSLKGAFPLSPWLNRLSATVTHSTTFLVR